MWIDQHVGSTTSLCLITGFTQSECSVWLQLETFLAFNQRSWPRRSSHGFTLLPLFYQDRAIQQKLLYLLCLARLGPLARLRRIGGGLHGRRYNPSKNHQP